MQTRGDVWTSLTVIAALVGARFGVPILDPLAALVVAGFIGHAGYQIARATTGILSDRIVISDADLERVVMSVPGVLGCHHIRTRGSADHVFLDLHVWLPPDMRLTEAHELSHVVKDRLMARYPQIADAVIHIEPPPPIGRSTSRRRAADQPIRSSRVMTRFEALRRAPQDGRGARGGDRTVRDRASIGPATRCRRSATPGRARLFDGPFYVSPRAARRSARGQPRVRAVARRQYRGATNPSTLGGGEADKHLIYEGLSRVAADAVLVGRGDDSRRRPRVVGLASRARGAARVARPAAASDADRRDAARARPRRRADVQRAGAARDR